MKFMGKLSEMWENIDIRFVTTEKRRNYLVSEASHHTTKFFTEQLLAIEVEKLKY